MRNFVAVVIAFVVGLGGGAALGYYFFAKPAAAQVGGGSATQPGAPPTQVGGRGRLEPAGGVINLAAPGPDVLDELLVGEGDTVQKDQPLANLGSRKARQIEYDLAQAQLVEAKDTRQKTLDHLQAQKKESEAHIEQLKKQGPRDVEMQQAKITVLQKQSASAKDLLDRMRKAGSYPEQQIQQQELASVQAQQELEGAQSMLSKIKDANDATLRAAEAQLDVVVSDIKRAQSQNSLASLQRNVDLAAERLKQSVVRAPVGGKILKVLAHVGELVGTQPVFQLGDVTHMVAVAEIYETDVKTVRDWVRAYPGRVGADVEIRFPGAAPSKFHGIVERVADLVGKNSALSVDPRQDVDRRVVEVRIKLDDQYQKEAAEFVNMQVDVTIKSPK